MDSIWKLTEEEEAVLLDLRHDLHRHPELSRREYRTTERIRRFLSALPGCQLIDLPAETGVVARFGGASGEEIMLRADIDALPQTEQNQIPWRSEEPGVMHACGHDLHTAALCGAAMILNRAVGQGALGPTVDLVFQPAEEGTTGARTLIGAGLFDHIAPQACYGMHNWPSVDTGRVVCRAGALMAAKVNFDINLYGAGGHGSMPHLNIDPIVCAAAVVQSLQTVISRNTDPLDAAILSINMISGGSPMNLVVDKVLLKATVRSLSDAALDKAVERVKTIVHHTAAAYQCRSEILWQERIPAVVNTPEMTDRARKIAALTDCVLTAAPPSLASEDFALYRSFAPVFFFWLGSRKPGTETHELHTPLFLADDAALRHGAELYAACAAAHA